MPDPTYSISIEFVSGSYTNVSSHCFKIDINNSLARGALEGAMIPACHLVMNNQDGQFSRMNSYSPYYPNIQIGKNMRVSATYGGSSYPLFTGVVESYSMDPMLGSEIANIVAHGLMGKLQRKKINLPILSDIKPNSLFTEIFSASLVASYSVDPMWDIINYSWYNDTPPMDAINDLVSFGNYYFYEDGGGTLLAKDRYWLSLKTTVASYVEFYSLRYVYDKNSIINQSEIRSVPKKLSTVINTVTYLDVVNTYVYVPGSGTIGLTLTYVEPLTGDQGTPAINMITPVASTDYLFVADPDGMSLLHSTTSLYVTYYATTVVCTLSNNYHGTLFIKRLQFRGNSFLTHPEKVAVYENASSQNVYGQYLFTMTNDLFGDTLQMDGYAQHIVSEKKEPITQVSFELKNQWPDCLSRSLGDIVNLINSKMAVSGRYSIQTVSHTIDTTRGLEHVSTYDVNEWVDGLQLILDHPTMGLLDSGRIWGF